MKKPPPPDPEALALLWKTRTIQHICDILGLTRRRLYHFVDKYNLGPKPFGTHGKRHGTRQPDPTPTEIRLYTLSLQAHWDDAERDRRAGRRTMALATKVLGYDGRSMKFSEKLM